MKTEVLTDNEIIAEFMGIRFVKEIGGVKYWNAPKDTVDMYNVSQGVLNYHKRWDCLMPVVEKIAKIETNDVIHNGEDSYFDSYFPRTFGMINSETKEFMVRINRSPLHQSSSLIEATYKAVVEFIKWYNQQKP